MGPTKGEATKCYDLKEPAPDCHSSHASMRVDELHR